MGTELADALVAYGFEMLKLTAVFATVAMQNIASLALLNRIGFEQVRDIKEDGRSTIRVLTHSLTANNRSSFVR